MKPPLVSRVDGKWWVRMECGFARSGPGLMVGPLGRDLYRCSVEWAAERVANWRPGGFYNRSGKVRGWKGQLRKAEAELERLRNPPQKDPVEDLLEKMDPAEKKRLEATGVMPLSCTTTRRSGCRLRSISGSRRPSSR